MKPPHNSPGLPDDVVDHVIADWRRERPDVDVSPIGVFGRLTRIVAAQRAILNTHHEALGLAQGSFDVLANLRRSGPPHRKTAGELAASSMLSAGGITFRLDKMEQAGLIRRIRSTEDRRLVYAELTSAGRELIDTAIDSHVALQDRMLADLEPSDREQLTQLLRRLEASVATCRPPRDAAT